MLPPPVPSVPVLPRMAECGYARPDELRPLWFLSVTFSTSLSRGYRHGCGELRPVRSKKGTRRLAYLMRLCLQAIRRGPGRRVVSSGT